MLQTVSRGTYKFHHAPLTETSTKLLWQRFTGPMAHGVHNTTHWAELPNIANYENRPLQWEGIWERSCKIIKYNLDNLTLKYTSHAFLENVISDNGSHVQSIMFQTFMKLNRIKYVLVPSYYLELNGAAERSVRICKEAVREKNEQFNIIPSKLVTKLMELGVCASLCNWVQIGSTPPTR